MAKRLALNVNGDLTFCTAAKENIGKGRCNHLLHQELNESKEDFMEKASNLIIKNNKKDNSLVQLDKNYELIKTKIPLSYLSDNKLIFENKVSKLEVKHKGNQHKGQIIVEEDGEQRIKFLKLDELSPAVKGRWESDSMDLHHSSITEDICSKLLSNIENKENFNSVLYRFVEVENGNKTETGCISNSYLYSNDEGEELHEKFIALYNKTIVDKTIVDHDEYLEKVIDEKDTNKRFENLKKYYVEAGVPEQEANDFILKQAAFDLLTCNTDRRQNAGNTVLIKNDKTGKTQPINIDFGRCLTTNFSKDSEQRVDNMEDYEFFEEDGSDAFEMHNKYNGGFFGSLKLKESVDFLFEKGFEPFKLNKNKLLQDLDELYEQSKKSKVPLKNYTRIKLELIKCILQDKELKRLWEEV